MKDPIEVIDAHADALRTIAVKLLADCERRARVEIDLHKRLQDALDEVYALKLKLREQEEISEELRQINRGRR